MSLLFTKIQRSIPKNNIFKHYATGAKHENHNDGEKQTHFGFQNINESEKTEKVRQVFHDVAEKYDVMNDAMSFGVHRFWKDVFIHRLSPPKNTKLLDVAGGTGDISFRFLNYIKHSNCEEGCHVTVCDINEDMLTVGKERSKSMGNDPNLISWQQGNAESLPFDDNSFNAYTIAFGIRNVTHIDKALEEAYRVLKHGGRFMCLEFSHLIHPSLQWAYDQYSFEVIPVMGHVIAGKWQPYQYLVESIRKFPDQEKFKEMIQRAGFRGVYYENLTLGVCAIHTGFKL